MAAECSIALMELERLQGQVKCLRDLTGLSSAMPSQRSLMDQIEYLKASLFSKDRENTDLLFELESERRKNNILAQRQSELESASSTISPPRPTAQNNNMCDSKVQRSGDNSLNLLPCAPEYPTCGVQNFTNEALNSIHHKIRRLYMVFEKEKKISIPIKEGNEGSDLTFLLLQSFRACQAQCSPSCVPSCTPGTVQFQLRSILAAVTTGALCFWVFNNDFERTAAQPSPLSEAYRQYIRARGMFPILSPISFH